MRALSFLIFITVVIRSAGAAADSRDGSVGAVSRGSVAIAVIIEPRFQVPEELSAFDASVLDGGRLDRVTDFFSAGAGVRIERVTSVSGNSSSEYSNFTTILISSPDWR